MTDQFFRSGSGRAKLVVWLFIAGIITGLLSIGSEIVEIELTQHMLSGGNWTEAEHEANDMRVTVIASVNLLISFAGMIAFLAWIYRAMANLLALGIKDARWSPGWAVGWWFVPLMNLFRPFQVVADAWKASAPGALPDSSCDAATPPLLKWWWAFFLIAWSADFLAYLLSMTGPVSIDRYLLNSATYIVNNMLWLVGAILAIMVVRGIDRRQADRYKALSERLSTEVHLVPA